MSEAGQIGDHSVHIVVSGGSTTGRNWSTPSKGDRGKGTWGVDPFDVRLQDDELLDEVELTANLIVAANQAEARMSMSEIDQILGVLPHPREGS